jgi:hypothetical protein
MAGCRGTNAAIKLKRWSVDPSYRLSLSRMLGEPLCHEDQRGPGGGIVDGEEGLQEIETITGDGIWDRTERRHLARNGSPAAGTVATGRLQLHDIASMATLEGLLSLDLATRHNALPMPKITGTRRVNYRG